MPHTRAMPAEMSPQPYPFSRPVSADTQRPGRLIGCPSFVPDRTADQGRPDDRAEEVLTELQRLDLTETEKKAVSDEIATAVDLVNNS